MCKLTHESLLIQNPIMFDAELNFVFDGIIFKECH